jgi:hypothetical protein
MSASALCFSSSIFEAMILVPRPRKLARHSASDVCRRRRRLRRVVAAGAVALVIVGCGANEAGAPAIAVAVANTAVGHHDYELGVDSVSGCAQWELMDESTELGAAFQFDVHFLMGAETSAIYSRPCGSHYQYKYVDTRNGQESCIGGPIPHTSQLGEVVHYFYLDLDRCR